jgi:hypothetical protein
MLNPNSPLLMIALDRYSGTNRYGMCTTKPYTELKFRCRCGAEHSVTFYSTLEILHCSICSNEMTWKEFVDISPILPPDLEGYVRYGHYEWFNTEREDI